MHKIVSFRVLSGFRLWLRYADGVEGEVDLFDLAGHGVFEVWNDRRFFEAALLDVSGTLVWGDSLDLCPDALYLRLTGKSPEEIFPKLKGIGIHVRDEPLLWHRGNR